MLTMQHAQQQTSKTKTETMTREEGTKAKFVSYVKLVEAMGVTGANNYVEACQNMVPRRDWMRWSPMAKLWFYNFTQDVAQACNKKDYEIK